MSSLLELQLKLKSIDLGTEVAVLERKSRHAPLETRLEYVKTSRVHIV
jgi:hypothetical protein